jgi:SAM-dependent methyltransferase
MRYAAAKRVLPDWLRRYIYSFETMIEAAVEALAHVLPEGARVLDAGAGEGQYAEHFRNHRYTGVDLGVGDAAWNYGRLDAVADLTALPFRDATFHAVLNIVTLEHLREPLAALREVSRVLKPGGVLLLIAPHEWEVHQSPHDYFRYTRHGLQYLLDEAGLRLEDIAPAGGYFRLVSRRLLAGLQFFPGVLKVPAALVFAPLALVLPLLEPLDRDKNFTLGYRCLARKAR